MITKAALAKTVKWHLSCPPLSGESRNVGICHCNRFGRLKDQRKVFPLYWPLELHNWNALYLFKNTVGQWLTILDSYCIVPMWPWCQYCSYVAYGASIVPVWSMMPVLSQYCKLCQYCSYVSYGASIGPMCPMVSVLSQCGLWCHYCSYVAYGASIIPMWSMMPVLSQCGLWCQYCSYVGCMVPVLFLCGPSIVPRWKSKSEEKVVYKTKYCVQKNKPKIKQNAVEPLPEESIFGYTVKCGIILWL